MTGYVRPRDRKSYGDGKYQSFPIPKQNKKGLFIERVVEILVPYEVWQPVKLSLKHRRACYSACYMDKNNKEWAIISFVIPDSPKFPFLVDQVKL